MYTDRHNASGLLILKAVRSGKHGNTVVQADVSSQDKQTREGMSPLPREILQAIMPGSINPEDLAQYNQPDSRPDITMYSTSAQDGTTRHTYTLVEIKYGVDTKPEDQRANAQAQHAQLLTALNAAPNTNAELITITLGAAGYIYKETHEQLQKLGISGKHLSSLINNLHIQAVKSLTSIIGTRRHSERAQHQRKLRYGQPASHQPSHTSPTIPAQPAQPSTINKNGKCRKPLTTTLPRQRKKRKKY